MAQVYKQGNNENNQQVMFIKKGKLCAISKFAKKFIIVNKIRYIAVQFIKIAG